MKCKKCKDTGWLDAPATMTFSSVRELRGQGAAPGSEDAEDTVDVVQRRGCDCPAGRVHARRISGAV